jgi:hypothetical protein
MSSDLKTVISLQHLDETFYIKFKSGIRNVSKNLIFLYVFLGSLYVFNDQSEVKYEAIRNLNEIFFSIFYNPRKKTGKLVGSNSTGEVIFTNLSGTRYPLLSEPSYFKIDLSLASGSPVLFNIHFCILENGKCEPNPNDMPIILGSSGALIFLIIVVILIVCCILKRKKKMKPDANVVPNDVELFDIHKNPYYESSSTDTEQKVTGNRD